MRRIVGEGGSEGTTLLCLSCSSGKERQSLQRKMTCGEVEESQCNKAWDDIEEAALSWKNTLESSAYKSIAFGFDSYVYTLAAIVVGWKSYILHGRGLKSDEDDNDFTLLSLISRPS